MKKRRAGIKAVVWIAGILVVLFGVWYMVLRPADVAPIDPSALLDFAQASRNTVTVTAYGSGTIAVPDQKTVFSGAEGKVEAIPVRVGDVVQPGDILLTLSNDDLEEQIATAELELLKLDLELAKNSTSSDSTTVKAPVKGRVKQVVAQEEDDVFSVFQKHGYLCVLSTDGSMKISFEVEEGIDVSAGDKVNVLVGTKQEEGYISEMAHQGKAATAVIGVDTYDVDAPATVLTLAGQTAGRGSVKINRPVPITGVGGSVKSIKAVENKKVDKGDTLFTLEDIPYRSSFEVKRLEREAAARSLDTLKGQRAELTLVAPVEGTVTEIALVEGDRIQKDVKVLTLLRDEATEAVIAVDELDIPRVALGQEVEIKVDAFEDKRFQGTVKRIAPTGNAQGGVTYFDVTIALPGAEGLMPGMSVSGDIVVAESVDTLVVPAEAVISYDGGKYVLMADLAEQLIAQAHQSRYRSAQEQRMMQLMGMQTDSVDLAMLRDALRPVEIGLISAEYAQVTSGLSEGERIAIQHRNSSTSMRSGMGGMMGGGPRVP